MGFKHTAYYNVFTYKQAGAEQCQAQDSAS